VSAKRRITVNLTDAEYATLSKLAERFQVSLAWLGRRALAELVEKYQHRSAQMPLPFTRTQAPEAKR
jgi:predicted transcriptional regulator